MKQHAKYFLAVFAQTILYFSSAAHAEIKTTTATTYELDFPGGKPRTIEEKNIEEDCVIILDDGGWGGGAQGYGGSTGNPGASGAAGDSGAGSADGGSSDGGSDGSDGSGL